MVEIDKVVMWATAHRLLLLLSLAGVFTIIWLLKLRKHLKAKAWVVLLISVLHVVYGVFCVRIFAAIEGHPEAMSLYGAVFFMPIGYFIGAKIFKRPLSDVFDIFSICMIATLLLARINCLFAGCCKGRLISEGSALCWPTREIEIVYYIAFMAYFIPKVVKGKTHGEVYPLYLLSYGSLRFILEFFRESSYGKTIDWSHLWSLISIAAGLSVYVTLKHWKGKKSRNSGK